MKHDEVREFNPDLEPLVLRDGTVLDRAGIEAMVAEDVVVARQMRSERQRGLVPGGKSLTAEGVRSPVVQVSLPAPTYELLKRLAAEQHVSVAKYTRRLIEQHLPAA
ncbi:MAG TPA: hypothetical protein VFU07_06800 [Candidatus Lumbricidophila sp.]|nr:hypothetical protein [Candidatus Lumbricidophila sp.]